MFPIKEIVTLNFILTPKPCCLEIDCHYLFNQNKNKTPLLYVMQTLCMHTSLWQAPGSQLLSSKEIISYFFKDCILHSSRTQNQILL